MVRYSCLNNLKVIPCNHMIIQRTHHRCPFILLYKNLYPKYIWPVFSAYSTYVISKTVTEWMWTQAQGLVTVIMFIPQQVQYRHKILKCFSNLNIEPTPIFAVTYMYPKHGLTTVTYAWSHWCNIKDPLGHIKWNIYISYFKVQILAHYYDLYHESLPFWRNVIETITLSVYLCLRRAFFHIANESILFSFIW